MFLWFAFAVFVACHLAAVGRAKWLYWLSKPAAILALVFITLTQTEAPGSYQWPITIALLLCVVGDLFLMWSRTRIGLGFFSLAHLCCCMAFWSEIGSPIVWWLPALFYAAGTLVYLLMLPNLHKMAWPGLLYTVSGVSMAWIASEVGLEAVTLVSGLASVAACLFLFSAFLFALEQFRGGFSHARSWVLLTYFSAQSLLTASVVVY
ncbi:lysoplasmalogenase [Thaumasiovibrio subtropicus]|uniref:lysoplasmalogenase n=1 Tax=Thaumasiovibrio subtropicus TaxID=1891207 RepID=UPI000B360904|nr:lysoplasmalogenase [Thaumasiovibrio subtropicus]